MCYRKCECTLLKKNLYHDYYTKPIIHHTRHPLQHKNIVLQLMEQHNFYDTRPSSIFHYEGNDYINQYEFRIYSWIRVLTLNPLRLMGHYINSLPWRHNDRNGVSNHQPHDCLLNRLFRFRSKKASKLCVTSLCEGNSQVPGEFPAQTPCKAEKVSIWWRHHIKLWFHETIVIVIVAKLSYRRFVYCYTGSSNQLSEASFTDMD